MRIHLDEAIQLLNDAHVVAVPTETVYGLAASLRHLSAIEQIYSLKGRPRANPMIVHVNHVDRIKSFSLELPPQFNELALAFWPGPMTLILPVNTSLIPSLVRSDLPTVGFRIPKHAVTLALLKETGPLVMPSANLSGKPSATSPEHVEEDFGLNFPVLDGGNCEKGLESTILCYQKDRWVILRLGSLEPAAFLSVLGYEPEVILKTDSSKPLCPGQLFRHYAPKAKLLFGDSIDISEVSFIIGFKERIYPKEKRIIHLGSLLNPNEVAENLYKVLRQLDQEKAQAAWVDMDFPSDGLWQTIRERLTRASEIK